MHFEVLVEDPSGKQALEILLKEILRERVHTYRVVAYRGLGGIPKGMKNPKRAATRALLNKLPGLLSGYGRTHQGYGTAYRAAVLLVCDLDDRCLKEFREELIGVLDGVAPRPVTRFCFAVEESEAWLLGDLDAVLEVYPRAKREVLKGYINDSICGTWETLADAVYRGGANALRARGWQAVGMEKSAWAKSICPFMRIDRNSSPSFQYFRDTLLALSQEEPGAESFSDSSSNEED